MTPKKVKLHKQLNHYFKSINHTIYDAYKKPSDAKINAYHLCLIKLDNYNGSNLRIVSHNSHFFSAGFIGIYDGKTSYFHITHENFYYMPLE